MSSKILVKKDYIDTKELCNLLTSHLENMLSGSPIESVHALSLDKYKDPNLTLWSAWIGGEIAGCGALLRLNSRECELKSMRTDANFLREGVAKAVLDKIINEAKSCNYSKIYLETGSAKQFYPAHRLYERNGFNLCSPFAGYIEDKNSIFMVKNL